MKLIFFKKALEKVKGFTLRRNAVRLAEKDIITKEEAIMISQGTIRNENDLYNFRREIYQDYKEYEENNNQRKR